MARSCGVVPTAAITAQLRFDSGTQLPEGPSGAMSPPQCVPSASRDEAVTGPPGGRESPPSPGRDRPARQPPPLRWRHGVSAVREEKRRPPPPTPIPRGTPLPATFPGAPVVAGPHPARDPSTSHVPRAERRHPFRRQAWPVRKWNKAARPLDPPRGCGTNPQRVNCPVEAERRSTSTQVGVGRMTRSQRILIVVFLPVMAWLLNVTHCNWVYRWRSGGSSVIIYEHDDARTVRTGILAQPGVNPSAAALIGLAVPLTLLALDVYIVLGWRRAARVARGLCAKCGYDLRGTESKCPECGTPRAGPLLP